MSTIGNSTGCWGTLKTSHVQADYLTFRAETSSLSGLLRICTGHNWSQLPAVNSPSDQQVLLVPPPVRPRNPALLSYPVIKPDQGSSPLVCQRLLSMCGWSASPEGWHVWFLA